MKIVDITNSDERKPVAWVVRSHLDGVDILVFRDADDVCVCLSEIGVGTHPRDTITDPDNTGDGAEVIKRYYPGDVISFTLDEGF